MTSQPTYSEGITAGWMKLIYKLDDLIAQLNQTAEEQAHLHRKDERELDAKLTPKPAQKAKME